MSNPSLKTLQKTQILVFAMALILLELSMIRLLDIYYSAYTSFIAIALSLFLIGIGGFLGTILCHRRKFKWIPLLYPILTPLSYNFLYYQSGINFLSLFTLGIPILLGSFGIAQILWDNRQQTANFYFFDLIGVAFGGLIVFLFLPLMGPEGLILLSTFAVLFIQTMTTLQAKRMKIRILALNFFGLLIFLVAFMQYDSLRVLRPKISKYMRTDIAEKHIEYRSWSPIVRIDVADFQRQSKEEPLRTTSQIKYLLFDGGTIGSNIYNFDGDYEKLRREYINNPESHFLRLASVASHHLKRDTGHSAFLIGVGAGQELKAALMYNAKKVIANELIGDVIELSLNEYSQFNGNIFNDPRVELSVGDGRIALENSTSKFDVIQIFSNYLSSTIAQGKGLFNVTYLFTKEAFELYFQKLNTDGILQINQYGSDQIYGMAKAAWSKTENSRFSDHAVVIKNQDPNDILDTFLIKKSPWTENELNELDQLFAQHPTDNFLISRYPGKILPEFATDSRPFYTQFLKPNIQTRVLGFSFRNLLLALITILLFSFIFFVVYILRKENLQSKSHEMLWQATSFFIGVAFVFLQLSVEKFLLRSIDYPNWSQIIGIVWVTLSFAVGSLMFSKSPGFSKRIWIVGPVILFLASAMLTIINQSLATYPLFYRVLWILFPLFTLGLSMGSFFPQSLKNSKYPHWIWLFNGLGAGSGALFSQFVQMNWGITFGVIIAAAIYLVVVVILMKLSQPHHSRP